MSTRRWLGNAVAVAQETTSTVTGTWSADDTITATINTKDITFTVLAGSTAIGDVVAGLVAAWNASSIPEAKEITAVNQDPVIRFIEAASSPIGKPFTIAMSDTAASGAAGAATEAVAGTGPNYFTNADNWSGNTVPVDADDIVYDSGKVDCIYGLSNSAITPASITITAGYGGKIGLPEINVDDQSKPYPEYRTKYLTLGNSGDAQTVTLNIDAATSGRIRIANGTAQVVGNLYNTGQAAETNVPVVLWTGTHASNVWNVTKGSLGVAFYAGETATVATLKMAYRDNQTSDAQVTLGAGTTLTTITMNGGVLVTNSAVTTVNMTAGNWRHEGTGAVTTINADAGRVQYNGTGTITTANVGSGANLDLRGASGSLAITNLNLYEKCEFHDPAGRATATPKTVRCTPQDVVFDVPINKTWTPS